MVYAIQVNLYSIFILLIMWIGLKRQPDVKSVNNRIFGYLIILNMIVLLMDLFSFTFDGNPSKVTPTILIASNVVLFSLSSAIGLFWLAYVDYYIHKDMLRLKKHALIASIPFFINLVASFSSIFYGTMFTVGESNAYLRGDYFWINAIILYGYIFFALFHIVRCRKKLAQNDVLPLILFALPPMIAGVLQILFYGLIIIWPMTTLSFLIAYLYVQLKIINTDYLTGLYNRREFDYYVSELRKKDLTNSIYGCTMMDLDNLKYINDFYGHHFGDIALQETSNILREAFDSKDFVARLGGDEFVAIFELNDSKEMDEKVLRIRDAFEEFNARNVYPFTITISIGAAIYEEELHEDFPKLFVLLDEKLYQEKTQKKLEEKTKELGTQDE